MQYSLRLSILLIVVSRLFILDMDRAGAQNKNNNRQDEKRENERVQKAERELSDARKQLGQILTGSAMLPNIPPSFGKRVQSSGEFFGKLPC
jgi:hypothetical protein